MAQSADTAQGCADRQGTSMATRMTSPFAGLGWLKNAINLGSRNPKAVFGGAALLALVSMLPSLVTLPVQYGMPGNMTAFWAAIAFSMVAGLLLAPVMGGYLQVIDAVEGQRPVRARDVFAPYRAGGGASRIILFALLLMVVTIAMFGAVVYVAAPGFGEWYVQTVANGVAAPQSVPTLPDNFGRAMAAFTVLLVLFLGVFAIGYGQVGIARRSPVAALGDAFAGSFKNVLALVVLLVSVIVLAVVLGLAMMLVVFLLGLLALVGGAWLVIALSVPVYVALFLVMYTVLFGMAYFLWRDVCGGDVATTTPAMAA